MKKVLHTNGLGIFAMLLFFFNFLTAQDNQECIVNIDDPNHFIVTPEQIANAASSLTTRSF